ncbi:MAG: tRNA (adenosine(37)-N6)-threonylcarbamoyltransferase complex ATPase subunit type 1 TsaE [Candidatus Rokuibacteriota bacterium]|nr:MAG: tRNA (adenosine(37)-N6)-threonylcarbamoyltransferase complex ATPase subunit type 1 TsaE [Candidatus Rokubacteria bacterium]
MSPTAEFLTRSADETERVGERLGRRLVPGDVVALSGELGAGKTCFIRGLARGLGVTQGVSSPTFVIVNQYTGRMPVFHIDAYRTESLTELLDIGFDEYVSGDSVTVIEWSDKLEPLLPPGAIRVRVSGLGDEPRTIRIDASEPRL